MRTLIVGGTVDRRRRIEDLLRELGHDVQGCPDVAQARALFEQTLPLMVVLVRLDPESLAFCRTIREGEEGTPVVLLGIIDPDTEEYLPAALEVGIDNCFLGTDEKLHLESWLILAVRQARKREQRRQIEADRERAEYALQESEARTRAILATTVDGIITIDARGIIQSFNPAAEKIFGYRAEEVIGDNVRRLMPPPFREEHDSYIQNYQETGRAKIIGIGREVVGLRKDGTLFPMDLAVSEMLLGDRLLFTGIVRDITDRRHLEKETLRMSERERRRIGQDLHDGLGQMLTGIGLICQNLARRMEREGQPAAAEVAEITDLIKEADQQARGLARGLIPVDLAASGLHSALQRLVLNAERLFGLRCTFEGVGSVLVHDNTVATHLYRIAQEALSNAVRHGQAQHVKISLAGGDGQIRLRIQDNGIGFPTELDEDRGGMGVQIMHFRARVIGATLEITDGLNGGTTITCTLHHIRTATSPQGGVMGIPNGGALL